MPDGDRNPDILLASRRRLGAELRRLREQAGLPGRRLAEQIGISQSKISRIESGTALPTIPEVTAWAAAAGAPKEAVGRAVALVNAAYTEVHSWDSAIRGQGGLQPDIGKIEADACAVLVYQPTLVPGLLQTAEYARRVFAMFRPAYPQADIPAVTASRVERQAALHDPDRRFAFLITEAALQWRPGPPGLLLAQLDRIASLSTLDNVTLGVIPQSARALTHVPHGFTMIEPTDREADPLVLAETVHASLTVSDPGQVALYRGHWPLLEKTAVHGQNARGLLTAIAADIRALSSEEGP